jgi:hypothetical protein
MSQFYNDMAASVLRADYTLYLVLTYLTIFRLEELTFNEYRKFIESQEPDKMSAFLSYIFDVKRLSETVKWEWLKIFDLDYVEDKMLRPLALCAAAAEKMRVELLAKASGLAAEKEASEGRVGIPELPKKRLTVPLSPRLTRPAPRAVEQPERISQEVVAKRVPRHIDRKPLAEVEKEKEERKKLEMAKTIQKYEQAKEQPFQLHETRNNLRDAKRDAEQKESAQLMFEMPPRSHTTSRPKSSPQFRMNTASYLREEALYKKKQAEEVKVIQAYESELRDSTEFYSWQTAMREQDMQGRREQVERVRMLAKQSADEAREAIEKQKRDNADVAALMKAESAEMQKQLEYEVEMQNMMNKQLVHEVIQVREHAPKEAKSKMLMQRKERHATIREELAELLSQKEEEERLLLEAREERVKQLKAQEVGEIAMKEFDPTESIGIGLLDEMSLLEMRERLEMNKLREKEREDDKRKEIIESKRKHQESLRKRVENIERFRSAASDSSKESRTKRKLKEEAEAHRIQEERNINNLVLLQHLEERRGGLREERRLIAEEEEKREKVRSFGGQGAQAKEELHFLQLLQGAEREAINRQEEAQTSSKYYEATKIKAREEIEKNTKAETRARMKSRLNAAEEIEKKRKELILKEKAEALSKKTAFLAQREKHRQVKERIETLNPYATTRTEMSRSKREKFKQSLVG